MWKVVSFLMKHSRGRILAAALVGGLSGAGTALLMALISRQLTADRFSWATGAWLFAGVMMFMIVTSLASRLLLIQVMQQTEYRLRLHLSRQILVTPLRQLEVIGANRLFASLTQDVPTLSNALGLLPNVCINAALLAGCLLFLAWLSVPVLLALTVFLAVTVVINVLLNRRANDLLIVAREKMDAIVGHFTALNDGIKELKLHGARCRAFLEKSLEPTAAALLKRNVEAMKAYAVAGSWGQVMFFLFLGLLTFGLPQVQAVEPRLLTSFILTLLFLRGPVSVIVDSLPGFSRASVALRKVEQIGLSLSSLDDPAEVVGPPGRPVSCRRIDLSDITHTYYREQQDDNFVLGKIDLSLEAGELLFLVGGNGSGKTTLAKVLAGLYVPETGEIRMDGERVTAQNRNEYRQLFSAVFSDFYLFESLLGLDRPELDGQAREYLERLHLERKVRIEKGVLSTTELSRGQRKRLALLTAYLEDRPFYIFDEWAADQDPVFKEIFYHQLLPDLRARGKGVLVVSHDVHYHTVADRIVRLDFGKLVDELPNPRVSAGSGLAGEPAVPSGRLR